MEEIKTKELEKANNLKEKKQVKNEWYSNATLITNIILIVIIINIVMSQSFAVRNEVEISSIIRSLINHNFIYIIALTYFALLKTNIGKKNFNILNLLYIGMYLLMTFASILTIFQSFGISSLLTLCLNFIILIYMTYTFIKQTRYWTELALYKIPFDEIKNEWYLYSICVISGVILLVSLVGSINIDGIVLSILDTIYIILFGRYIYLYKDYEDSKAYFELAKKNIRKKAKKNDR